jgi:hypothetical protein
VDPARDEHDEHPVAPRDGAPDDVGVVRGSEDDRDTPLELVELPKLCSRHTPTTSYPRSSACCTMYCPSFPEAPTMQTLIARLP